MSDDIYVATESGVFFAGGERYVVHKDQTRIRSGHPLLKRNGAFFKPLDVTYEVEDARQAPGGKRGGRRKAAADDTDSSDSKSDKD